MEGFVGVGAVDEEPGDVSLFCFDSGERCFPYFFFFFFFRFFYFILILNLYKKQKNKTASF